MKPNPPVRIWIAASVGFSLLLLVGLVSGVGAYVGNRLAQDQMIQQMPPIELKAGTASRTKSLSMATGLIDNNAEALFILDHTSGNLQCWLLNTRTGNVGGIYTANVALDMGSTVAKSGDPDYVMTTGSFFFRGNTTGNMSPSKSVCYVADATNGKVVGYGLIYNTQAVTRGVMQSGKLNVVCSGTARGEMTTRDQ